MNPANPNRFPVLRFALFALILILLLKEIRDTRTLKDSVEALSRRVAALEKQTLGLGDDMTAMQFHMGKLWFAGKALNWELAGYELDELKEGIESAVELHAVKNNVDTSGVLKSLLTSQIEPLGKAILNKDLEGFKKGYLQTLEACNQCHQTTAHGFNVITLPTTPPVSNQLWEKTKTSPAPLHPSMKGKNF